MINIPQGSEIYILENNSCKFFGKKIGELLGVEKIDSLDLKSLINFLYKKVILKQNVKTVTGTSKVWFSENATTRGVFVKACFRNDWNEKDFEEEFSHYVYSNNKRFKRFFYKEKGV